MGYSYPEEYKEWSLDGVKDLFDAELNWGQIEMAKYTYQNIENYASEVDGLVLWLDCDREGEAICYEVIDICQSVNQFTFSNDNIFRATFSAVQ